ncbi:MAG: class I SAM-dependent methyltransferase [Planctomycetota bacterium]
MDRYALAAPIYDACTLLWSGGAIWRTRREALRGPLAGRRVLVPGPGTGRSAALAARAGAQVVAVERSPAMARRARARFARERVDVELVEDDLAALPPEPSFDLVLAEHFLNVFTPEHMSAVRDDLLQRVRPGGALAIADFAPLRPGLGRPLQSAYHWIPLTGCALLTRNARHPIYDHGAGLRADPRVRSLRTYDARIFGVGPGWFRTWIFERTDA